MATVPLFGRRAVEALTQEAHLERKQLLSMQKIVKRYGNTLAADHLSMVIGQGEVVGLVGSNGAGKSTLMRIVSGVTHPEEGTMEYQGGAVDWRKFNPTSAAKMGIRVVYQELSLCDNLKVYENFYVELNQLFPQGRNWRKQAARTAREALEEIFPDNGIDVKADLAELSIAQQQMVEIARAFSDPSLKLLILDEPTSSLPARQTRQLMDHIRKKSAQGVTFIYITHRLFEVMEITDRIYVMKNGSVVGRYLTSDTTEKALIQAMGNSAAHEGEKRASHEIGQLNEKIYIKCDNWKKDSLYEITCELKGGELIGVGGLEGNGQKELLKGFFQKGMFGQKGMHRCGKIAFVTGNRKEEGNFPLWSIADNMAVTTLVQEPLYRWNKPGDILGRAKRWFEDLKIKGEGPQMNILSLSGGNQQKALIARAFLADADILLLDDPTRGVDVETKEQLYQVFSQAAREGKLVIWYSSDDEELRMCSRVLIMGGGTITAVLGQEKLKAGNLVEAAFSANRSGKKEVAKKVKSPFSAAYLIPLLSMLLVYVTCGLINSSTFTIFGMELLISGSLPLIFATISQVFIIGLSQVNLGIGNFMGLISVIIATIFYEKPWLGTLLLLGALLLYGGMGLLIYYRNIPAVIVTLGSSFVWTGMALVLQTMPGGNCPQWLITCFNTTILGLPSTIWIAAAGAAGAVLIYRSRYGTVMRGFGNREVSMIRSGWSKRTAFFMIYICSGVFGILGGVAFTAITYSADAQAMDSYTLLTVAAVILGGGDLNGGRVNHLGAVFGAVTLSLVTILLGFLHVNTDFTAAVQGLLLILILSLRLFKRGGTSNEA